MKENSEKPLKECINEYTNTLVPYINEKTIDGRSCAPVKALVTMLMENEIAAHYYNGAKIMTIEGVKATVITQDLSKAVGSVYAIPGDGEAYIPYSKVIEILAKLLGVEHKESPFVDPVARSQFLLEWYWKELRNKIKETNNE